MRLLVGGWFCGLAAFSLLVTRGLSMAQAQDKGEEADRLPHIVYSSPAINGNQGYATDGTHHYVFSTKGIEEADAAWKPVYANSSPFVGLPAGVSHVGDGDWHAGRLYVPVESYWNCKLNKHQALAVYTAGVAGLPLERYKDISMDRHEASSVTVVAAENSLYVSSYCNGTKLWIYDLDTLALKGTLKLSAKIARIQGISWDAAAGRFAVTADSRDQKTGYIYLVSPQGVVRGPVFTAPQKGELEGVDATQDTIRYLIGQHVYFLALPPEESEPRPAR